MEEKLNLREILGILRQRVAMILLMVVVAIGLAGGISYFLLTPMYESSTQILISQDAQDGQEMSERNVDADLQLVNTYSALIKSPAILEKVIDRMASPATVEELENQISVSSAEGSQLINVSVVDDSQNRAVAIANMTAIVFQEEVQTIIKANNVKILLPAVVKKDLAPISPNSLFNMAVGAAVGLMLGLGTAFLLAYLDTSIKSEEDIEAVLGVPVLAVISPIDENGKGKQAEKVALQEKEA